MHTPRQNTSRLTDHLSVSAGKGFRGEGISSRISDRVCWVAVLSFGALALGLLDQFGFIAKYDYIYNAIVHY